MLLGIYLAWLLDVIGLKKVARFLFGRWAKSHHHPYVVYSGALFLMENGQTEKAKELLTQAWEINPSIRCARLLIHLMIRDKEYEKAAFVAKTLFEKNPDNPWPGLLYADIERFFIGNIEEARSTYLKCLKIAESRTYGINPLKVVYKRIVRYMGDVEPREDLIKYLFDFMALEPSNFHDHEFDLLVRELLKSGQRDKAREVINLGIKAYPRSFLLRNSYKELGFGTERDLPPVPVRGKPLPAGVKTIPVKTRLFVEGDDPVLAVKEHVRDVEKDDVVTLSSCVAGLMEGRIFMEGAIQPGFLARLLSKMVDQKNVPFGGAAPMSNPLSMQVLIEEIGSLRTLVAAFCGALGKILGKKGWFYVLGGKDAGQIDDVLGSLPPYDYYVIMGPEDPSGLSERMAQALGCHAAIIDANDLGVAWAVGYSRGVEPRWLEHVMSQNPAGNQEQQTPVVIVRREEDSSVEKSLQA